VQRRRYDHSVREVAALLGIKLQTLDDWNCCGATEYFSQNELAACAVIARTWRWSIRRFNSSWPPAPPAT